MLSTRSASPGTRMDRVEDALADFGAETISDALRLIHPRVEVLGAGDELAVRLCGDLESDDVPTAHFHTEESH